MSQNDSSTKELSPNQKRALTALLSTVTVAEAAAACGLCEKTLYRYLANDLFKAELRARQDHALAGATANLDALANIAMATLRDAMEGKEVPAGVKVRAALGILPEKRKAHELDDLAERVKALEAALAEKAKPE